MITFSDDAGRTNTSGGPHAAGGPRVWDPCFKVYPHHKYLNSFITEIGNTVFLHFENLGKCNSNFTSTKPLEYVFLKQKLENILFFTSWRLSVGVPTSNGLDRPPATYYAQTPLAHHHHHHQHPSVNGNCQISELHSPTINITTVPVTHGNLLKWQN